MLKKKKRNLEQQQRLSNQIKTGRTGMKERKTLSLGGGLRLDAAELYTTIESSHEIHRRINVAIISLSHYKVGDTEHHPSKPSFRTHSIIHSSQLLPLWANFTQTPTPEGEHNDEDVRVHAKEAVVTSRHAVVFDGLLHRQKWGFSEDNAQ